MSLDDLKRNIERSICAARCCRASWRPRSTVTEAEARADYERHKARRTRARPSVHLQEIVVKRDGRSQARPRWSRAPAPARTSRRWPAQHSTAASRAGGGDLGQLQRGRHERRSWRRSAFALPAGGVSEPSRTEGGYRILKVVEKKEGSVVPFEEVKDGDRASASPRSAPTERYEELPGRAAQERGASRTHGDARCRCS